MSKLFFDSNSATYDSIYFKYQSQHCSNSGGQYAHTSHFLVLFVEDEFQITLLVLRSYH